MTVALQTLRDIGYDILREDQITTGAYPVSLMDLLLNSSQQRICNGMIVNPLTKEAITKGQLPFLVKETYYSSIPSTSLSVATTIGAVTLSVSSTTNYPATGYLFIGGDIITYNGKTATSFTGCSGVSFAFKAGIEISAAYLIPTDFANAINVTYNNKFKLEAKLFDDIFEDLNNYKGNNYQRNRTMSIYQSPYRINPFYTIKDRTYIIIYNLNDLESAIKLRYEKMVPTMTAIVDCSIDKDIYAQSTVPYLAIGEMLYNRGEEGRGGELINFAMGQVREMYNFYNKTSFEKLNGTHYRLGKGKLNI